MENSEVVWVVVEVDAGCPVLAEVYSDYETAYLREQELRSQINPEDDETWIFEEPIRKIIARD